MVGKMVGDRKEAGCGFDAVAKNTWREAIERAWKMDPNEIPEEISGAK